MARCFDDRHERHSALPCAMNSNRKALSGWSWTGIELIGQRFLAMGIAIIQARLLAPSDFGLIASLSIFLAIAQLTVDGAIGQRVVQKTTVSDDDYLALYWCNLTMSLMMSGILFISSQFISHYLGEPRLYHVTQFMAVVMFVSQAGRVQTAMLFRAHRFKRYSGIGFISNLVGAGVGLTLALCRQGVWALLWQQMAAAISRTFLLWMSAAWRPKFRLNWRNVKDIYGFGLPVYASQLVVTAAARVGSVVIAKLYNAQWLGFYDRGQFVPHAFTATFTSIFARVNFPLLASIKNDKDRLARQFAAFLEVAAWVAWPALAAIAILAEPLVQVLLGAKWLPSAPFMRLACMGGAVAIPYACSITLLRSTGNVKQFFKYHVMKGSLQIAGIAMGAKWGIEGLIVGQFMGLLIGYLGLMFGMDRGGHIPIILQMRTFRRPAIACFAVATAAAAIRLNGTDGSMQIGLVGLLAGAIAAALAASIRGIRIPLFEALLPDIIAPLTRLKVQEIPSQEGSE